MDSIINLDGDSVHGNAQQNENIVHIDVEPGTKKVLIQFLKYVPKQVQTCPNFSNLNYILIFD